MNFVKHQPQIYNGTGFDKYDFYTYLGENQFQKYDAYVASEGYGNEIILVFSVTSGLTLRIPLVNYSGEIDWGDGTKTNHNFFGHPSHIYNITSDVTVKIRGVCSSIYFTNTTTTSNNNLKEIVHIGDVGLTSLRFLNCSNLQKVNNPFYCPDLNTLSEIFQGCNSLQSIPVGLFDNCPNITTMEATFAGIPIQSIPSGLFDNCLSVSNFSSTFSQCVSLTGLAPELWTRTNVVFSSGCFFDCTNLSNYAQIPSTWK